MATLRAAIPRALEPRAPPALCPPPAFLHTVNGKRQRRCESTEGESDGELRESNAELEESVEELLSGPKDSVMMFSGGGSSGSRRCPWLQFEHTGECDPLDMLAREFQAHHSPPARRPTMPQPSCSQSASSCRGNDRPTSSEHAASMRPRGRSTESHSRELALRCHDALHRELDAFFSEAAIGHAGGLGQGGTPDAPQRDAGTQTGEDAGHYGLEADLQTARNEADVLRVELSVMERERWEALSTVHDAGKAKLQAAREEASSLRDEVERLRLAGAANLQDLLAAREEASSMRGEVQKLSGEASSMRGEVQKLSGEVARLRGDRGALQALDGSELAGLVDLLSDSIRRVQGEHLRRLERHCNEQLCVVCLEQRKNVVLQPCRHLTMCVGCFQKCSSACPQCRAPVQSHLVIYT